jgi:hypothetical protein
MLHHTAPISGLEAIGLWSPQPTLNTRHGPLEGKCDAASIVGLIVVVLFILSALGLH